MARTPDFDRYVVACDYPGVLDEAAVTASLQHYLSALGVVRTVRRLPPEWNLQSEAPLRRSIGAVLDDFARRIGWKNSDARAARDARAAIDALAARDALDVLAARAARAASAARDARAGALERFASWCLYRGGWWYSWDLSWIATTWLGSPSISWAKPLFEAYIAGAWMLYWTDDTLYWIAKPAVHVERVNGQRRLHCETGPAVASDAEPLYFWHGVLVPSFAVIRPDLITPDHIQQEDNAEVRRVLIERYGWERWLLDQGATPVQTDGFGALYRTTMDGEAIGVVVVTNSTPEPDGSRKRYALLVEPQHDTAHSAVASTFGLRAAEYQPMLES